MEPKDRQLKIYANGHCFIFGYGGLRTAYRYKKEAYEAAKQRQADLRAEKYGWNAFKRSKHLEEQIARLVQMDY
jgi:hypothetical protein